MVKEHYFRDYLTILMQYCNVTLHAWKAVYHYIRITMDTSTQKCIIHPNLC